MRISWNVASAYLCIAFLVCSCAAVDQFGSRIRDGNLNSQDALNQETLLNIVRAGDLQPLNFFAITQVSGGQTEALTTGIPTITTGPGTTVAQHQAVITNSLASGVSGGYQGNPLVSTTFQSAMLSPIDQRTLALLVAAHPREPVYYLTIYQITMRNLNSGKITAFVGDPGGDKYPDCWDMVENAPAAKRPFIQDCDYSVFQNYLEMFVTQGLFAELLPAPPTAAKSGTPPAAPPAAAPAAGPGSGNATPATAVGHICFNSTRSSLGSFTPRCGQLQTAPTGKTKSSVQAFNVPGLGSVEVNFVLRSPLAVYSYLGSILRYKTGNDVHYFTYEARDILNGEPFLNITGPKGVPCFTSMLYDAGFYCVPHSSRHTAMLLDILIQLRNLSISATDLNSAFTVRLSD